jgi:hypothetical protein
MIHARKKKFLLLTALSADKGRERERFQVESSYASRNPWFVGLFGLRAFGDDSEESRISQTKPEVQQQT